MISNAIFLANKPFILPLSLSLSLSLSCSLFSMFFFRFLFWIHFFLCLLVCWFICFELFVGLFVLDRIFVGSSFRAAVCSFFLSLLFFVPILFYRESSTPFPLPPPHLPPPAQDRRISPGVVRMLVRAARHQVASIRWSPGTFARFNLPNRGPVSSILPPLPFNWASNNVARNSNN